MYELCDSAGIYVMDEADCETHGLRGTLTSTPDWNAIFLGKAISSSTRLHFYSISLFSISSR